MSNQVVRTIRLSGQDAVEFANALFRPSKSEIEHRNRFIEHINENVEIRRNSDGYESLIADLDLSFLDEISTEIQMNINVTVEVKEMSYVFYSNRARKMPIVTVSVESENKYCRAVDNAYLRVAS